MGRAASQSHDQPLDLFAITLTILLCAIWGGAFVGIKVSTLDMPPMGSGSTRFCLTSIVLLLWARYQRAPLRPGMAEVKSPAILSALFLYINIAATVFFYTQPCGRRRSQ